MTKAIDLLCKKSEKKPFETTFGSRQKAFGAGKIKLLDLVNMGFKLNFNREEQIFNAQSLSILM